MFLEPCWNPWEVKPAKGTETEGWPPSLLSFPVSTTLFSSSKDQRELNMRVLSASLCEVPTNHPTRTDTWTKKSTHPHTQHKRKKLLHLRPRVINPSTLSLSYNIIVGNFIEYSLIYRVHNLIMNIPWIYIRSRTSGLGLVYITRGWYAKLQRFNRGILRRACLKASRRCDVSEKSSLYFFEDY